MRVQGIHRNTMPYVSRFQPYSAYATTIFFIVLIVFNGFDTIAGGFNYEGFITDYIGIPIYFGLYLFWRLYKKTHFISASQVDLWTGKSALDAIVWPERIPKNALEK